MDPLFTAALIQQGGPYLVILALLTTVGVLWKRVLDLQAKVDDLQEKRVADKDKQIDEGQESFAAVSTALSTVNKMIDAIPAMRRGRA